MDSQMSQGCEIGRAWIVLKRLFVISNKAASLSTPEAKERGDTDFFEIKVARTRTCEKLSIGSRPQLNLVNRFN